MRMAEFGCDTSGSQVDDLHGSEHAPELEFDHAEPYIEFYAAWWLLITYD